MLPPFAVAKVVPPYVIELVPPRPPIVIDAVVAGVTGTSQAKINPPVPPPPPPPPPTLYVLLAVAPLPPEPPPPTTTAANLDAPVGIVYVPVELIAVWYT